jgi:hypothetical protein
VDIHGGSLEKVAREGLEGEHGETLAKDWKLDAGLTEEYNICEKYTSSLHEGGSARAGQSGINTHGSRWWVFHLWSGASVVGEDYGTLMIIIGEELDI